MTWLGSIILPVPTARTKGVVITRTAYGNLLVGPTAEDQEDRRLATVERETLQGLMAAGERMLPGLAGMEVTTAYAGLRPATQFKDYQIEAVAERRWITVGGIRSTGLTGALGIARHVRGLYEAQFGALSPLNDPVWPEVPNLTEELARPYAQPGRSEIICHCELVTRERNCRGTWRAVAGGDDRGAAAADAVHDGALPGVLLQPPRAGAGGAVYSGPCGCVVSPSSAPGRRG